ncbi:hypothetical protein AFK24_02095 [Pseudomonas syringae]|uniref:RING-type E3 ubiquitin transferase n=1 Tax=Pseudomonas syringae TaxID=317 RepID=A0A1C7ZED3_PSESX|nr:hypothetical protein AFK24_02095 [Pseudomonas syringae]
MPPVPACPVEADGSAPFGTDHANLEFLKTTLPEWYRSSSKPMREALRASQLKSQRSRRALELIRNRLMPIQTFATPLLEQALFDRFKLRLDVMANELVTMEVKSLLLLETRTPVKQTLLHAALQNFEASESAEGGLGQGAALLPAEGLQVELIYGSGLLPDVPRFRYRYNGTLGIKPEQFAELSRTLNLGARYQMHLDSVFKPVTPQGQAPGSAAQAVASAFMTSERDAVEVLAHIAHMKEHISADSYQLLLELVKPAGNPRWHGSPVRYRQLHMLDTYAFPGSTLYGALLIEPDQPGDDLPCVVYLPGDPETPLKEYASFAAFTAGMRRKFFNMKYQEYFQRFVSLEQSHLFFCKLNERLTPLRPLPGDENFLTPKFEANAELYLEKRAIDKPPFEALYDHLLTKTYADSRIVAVPTSDEDRKSRLKRWYAFESAGMDLLMVAGFFVPVLGAILAVVAVGQLLSEAFVAVEDWTHGETEEALNHVFDIGENLAAMAVLGAAVHVAPRVLPSSFVESLTAVKLPNGLTRLWKPDLARFRQKVVLPSRVAADAQGLIKVDGKTWLPLAGELYRVEFDTALNRWRVKHPNDHESHSPVLEHNGAGTWRFEGENPMGWDETLALKRLNAAHEALADETLRRALRATGGDEALLRQVHVENLPAPALLSVTLQRFGIEQQVEDFITLMNGSDLDQVNTARIEPFLKLLTSTRRWPSPRGLRLLDEQGAVLESWNITSNSTSVIQVTYKPGGMTALLDTVLKGLLPDEVASLLGEEVEGSQAQISRLARNLSELSQAHRGQLLDELYALDQHLDDPLIKLIRRDFPDMPNAVARELVDSASPAQRQRMATTKRIPLSVAEQAREYQQQLRLNRVNEGFYRAVTHNPDTFKAGFDLLPGLPGWPADLAIELRDATLDGEQLDILGDSQSAHIHQVLVKTDTGYQTFRSDNNRIGGSDQTFFEALLQALPDSVRRDIGLPAVPDERDLRVLLGDYAATRRSEVAHLLKMRPIKPGFIWPYRLADGRVGYPMSGRMRGLFKMLGMGAHDYSPELAIKALYPGFIDDEVQAFLNQMRTGYTGEPWGFNAFAKARLKLLGREYKALEKNLDAWLGSDRTAPDTGSAVSESTYEARAAVAIRLKLGWKKMGMRRYNDMGEFIGYELDLSDLSVAGLPELHASFDHIGVLRAERLGLTTTQAQQLLKPFKNLRRLELDSNELTAVPAALGQQGNLQELSLRDNPLVVDEASVHHLSNLTSLKTLHLDSCPIGSQLDLHPLTALTTLGLRSTGIDALPSGLWDCLLLHSADLRDNQIVDLSDTHLANLNRAYARVQLHDNPLAEDSLLRASVLLNRPARARIGIGDARVHAEQPPGADAGWMENVAVADKQARIVCWEDLEAEPNSEDFFRVLHDLTHSSDFAHYQRTLSLRVWALLDVIADNRALREEVYALATHPQTCSDGVAMVFSDLEMHVRIFTIMASPKLAEHPARMFKLVRGLARLDEIEKIALENIRTRELLGETVDHVEVRMAFRTGLEQRLELPEQVRGMMFLALSGVSRPMLAAAEVRILAREGGPAFIHSLVQRDFWKQFLEKRFSQRFQTLSAPFYERLDALHDRRSELSDGEYLERVSAIQRERELAVSADAEQLTQDIARQIPPRESVIAGPSTRLE